MTNLQKRREVKEIIRKPKFSTVLAHASFLGHTGYANHTCNFFTELKKHIPVRVRNFAYTPNVDYLTQEQKDMIVYQTFGDEPWEIGSPFIPNDTEKILNIILLETNHFWFYEEYKGPKIAYNVWESTRQPEQFFEKLKEFDQVWVPTEWQRQCTIEQGISEDRVFVVPEGVDFEKFKPKTYINLDQPHKKFQFMIFGRWDYRKYTKEMVEAFLEEFEDDENAELLLSADNPFPVDGYNSTEERLEAYGLQDDRIKILHFPSDEEYVRYLQTGNCMLMVSRSEGWGLPAIEALACGTPTLITDWGAPLEYGEHAFKVAVKEMKKPENVFMQEDVPGEWAEPDYDDLKKKMRWVYDNYSFCKKFTMDCVPYIQQFSWKNAADKAMDIINNIDVQKYYLEDGPVVKNKLPSFEVSFIQGPQLIIKGNVNKEEYRISFSDIDSGVEVFSIIVKDDGWAKANVQYFVNWRVEVKKGDQVVFYHRYNAKGRKVFIDLDSKSIGDSIAWLPYCEEFRKKHGCELIVSTWWNIFFEKVYPEIKFIKKGIPIRGNIYARYDIGVYYQDRQFKNPRDWRTVPLQRIASDILGLEYKEVKPLIDISSAYSLKVKRPKKYVCFSEHSTAGCKYWNNPGGWQQLVDKLTVVGYDVVVISSEGTGLKGVINVTGNHIDVTIGTLLNCEFYVGVASGLAWLAWALGKQVVMISGFSEPFTEFESGNIRIAGVGNCTGCLNDVFLPDRAWDQKGDAGCFHSKGFSCTRDITADMVFDKLPIVKASMVGEEKV